MRHVQRVGLRAGDGAEAEVVELDAVVPAVDDAVQGEPIEGGNLLYARWAPRGPDVDKHDFTP